MKTPQRKRQRMPKQQKSTHSKKNVTICFRVDEVSLQKWKYVSKLEKHCSFAEYIRRSTRDGNDELLVFKNPKKPNIHAGKAYDLTHKIKIRLTQKEFSEWKQAAKDSGLNLSGWLRICIARQADSSAALLEEYSNSLKLQKLFDWGTKRLNMRFTEDDFNSV